MDKLDLHGIRHEDVPRMVIRFVESHWDEEDEFEIVTGNSWKMKNLVCDVLREYEITKFFTSPAMGNVRFSYD